MSAAGAPVRGTMPDAYRAALQAAHALADAGDLDAAVAAARQAVALMPERPAALATLAKVLADSGALDEAASLARAACDRAPGAVEFDHLATSIALRRGNFAAARDRATALLGENPRDQRARADLIVAEHALGITAHLPDYAAEVDVLPGLPPPGYATMPAFDRAVAAAVLERLARVSGPRPPLLVGGARLRDSFALAEVADGLRWLIADAVRRYTARRGLPSPAVDPRRLTCWANVMAAGDYERPHIHEQGWLSGVYYPQMPAGPADEALLVFGDHGLGPAVPPLPGWSVRPEAGQIVLFPSCLYHGTRPFGGPGQRISVAFDVAP